MADEQAADRIVAEFPKGQDMLRASLRTWKGKQYASLRVFFKPKGGGEWLPGKQGILLGIELLPQLEEAVRKLREAAGRDAADTPF